MIELRVPVEGAELHCRIVGGGPPLVVLHGGPDFDHHYFVPELDRLAESFLVVYYDQRGRGRSAAGVEPDDVGIDSELADLDAVLEHVVGGPAALLGHSWGGLLAMEYATRHPDRVTHLVLLDTAPATAESWAALREAFRRMRTPEVAERMQTLVASRAYRTGDLDVEAELNRLHFSPTVRDPALLEQLVGRLRAHFAQEDVVRARAIAQRLYDDTWRSEGYDLIPRLRRLELPTLVLHAEHDFIPVALAGPIAKAIPRSRLVVLPDCGHFTYLERPDEVHEHVSALVGA